MINHSILKHHSFTGKIISILKDEFGDDAIYIFENSPILGYLNIKTKSAERGSKSRGSFANHYALYVIIDLLRKYSSHCINQPRNQICP